MSMGRDFKRWSISSRNNSVVLLFLSWGSQLSVVNFAPRIMPFNCDINEVKYYTSVHGTIDQVLVRYAVPQLCSTRHEDDNI
jgi:hypothetical protein